MRFLSLLLSLIISALLPGGTGYAYTAEECQNYANAYANAAKIYRESGAPGLPPDTATVPASCRALLDCEAHRTLYDPRDQYPVCKTYWAREDLFESNVAVVHGSGVAEGGRQVRTELQGISVSENLPLTIIGYTRLAAQIMAYLAVLFIVYAGYLYIFAQGDASQKQKAAGIVRWVVIGILIVFVAYSIVLMVVRALFGELEIGLFG